MREVASVFDRIEPLARSGALSYGGVAGGSAGMVVERRARRSVSR